MKILHKFANKRKRQIFDKIYKIQSTLQALFLRIFVHCNMASMNVGQSVNDIYGCIRSAPSILITVPFIIALSIIDWTRCAYSSGDPSRCGNGTDFASSFCTFSGSDANKGVLKSPEKTTIIIIIRLKHRSDEKCYRE